MRGGIRKQIGAILLGILRIGLSRHKAKIDHDGKSPFIHSLNTFHQTFRRLRPLGEWLKKIGIHDLEVLTPSLIERYILDRLQYHVARGHARQTFKVELSALSALERGLTQFSSSHRSNPTVYDFSEVRGKFTQKARQLATLTNPYKLRALPDPEAAIDALRNTIYRIMALLQLETGARTEGIGAPSDGKNPFSMANFCHPETGVDMGIVNDPVTNQPVAKLWTKEKGGKIAFKYCSVELRETLEQYFSESCNRLEAKYKSYLEALNKAMKETNQYAKGRGSHGLRCNFARRRWAECLKNGYSDLEAKLLVSKEMNHNRPNVIEWYLGWKNN